MTTQPHNHWVLRIDLDFVALVQLTLHAPDLSFTTLDSSLKIAVAARTAFGRRQLNQSFGSRSNPHDVINQVLDAGLLVGLQDNISITISHS